MFRHVVFLLLDLNMWGDTVLTPFWKPLIFKVSFIFILIFMASLPMNTYLWQQNSNLQHFNIITNFDWYSINFDYRSFFAPKSMLHYLYSFINHKIKNNKVSVCYGCTRIFIYNTQKFWIKILITLLINISSIYMNESVMNRLDIFYLMFSL